MLRKEEIILDSVRISSCANFYLLNLSKHHRVQTTVFTESDFLKSVESLDTYEGVRNTLENEVVFNTPIRKSTKLIEVINSTKEISPELFL